MQRTSFQPGGLSRVLFVPDTLVTGELRESFLDRASFLVRTAPDAEAALSMAPVWQPSLVVFRAELDGKLRIADFCARLRAVSPNHPPKLVMLTETCGDTTDDVLEAGCDCHLISPVDTAQLLTTIGALLDVSQRRSPRVVLDTLVQTIGFDEPDAPSDPTLATTINVSEEGMLIESNRQLPLRSHGSLQFFLPGGSARLDLKGEVQLAVDEVRLHYAIVFTDIKPEERALLRDYVTECSAA